MFNLKNKVIVLFKALVAVLLMLCTQVIAVAGFMGPMVAPLFFWAISLPYGIDSPIDARINILMDLQNNFLNGNFLSLIVFYSGSVMFCLSLAQWIWYRHKKEIFFTKGLYSKVRHPQFLGIILVSLGLTIRLLGPDRYFGFAGSYFYLPFHGVGMNELIVLWFLQVLGYIGFALVEEWSLSRRLSEFKDYKEKVSFLFPIKNPKIIPEVVFTIMLVLVVCVILFFLPYDLLFWLRLP